MQKQLARGGSSGQRCEIFGDQALNHVVAGEPRELLFQLDTVGLAKIFLKQQQALVQLHRQQVQVRNKKEVVYHPNLMTKFRFNF